MSVRRSTEEGRVWEKGGEGGETILFLKALGRNMLTMLNAGRKSLEKQGLFHWTAKSLPSVHVLRSCWKQKKGLLFLLHRNDTTFGKSNSPWSLLVDAVFRKLQQTACFPGCLFLGDSRGTEGACDQCRFQDVGPTSNWGEHNIGSLPCSASFLFCVIILVWGFCRSPEGEAVDHQGEYT